MIPMKWLSAISACVLLLIASGLPAEDKTPAGEEKETASSAITYPEDLPRNLLLQADYVPENAPKQQEYVEVMAPEYPGLKIDLPSLKNLIRVGKPNIVFPTHDPSYYQEGGMILSYWGFPMASSQVISTAVPQIP